jgi:hypothetical protein
MNMTNDLRRRIKNAIIADMPTFGSTKRVDLLNAIEKRIREIAVAALPEKVRAVYDDADLREYVNYDYIYMGGFGYQLPAPVSSELNGYNQFLKNTLSADPALTALRETYDRMIDTMKTIERDINIHLATCKTVKAFTTRFPALAKYAPEQSPRASVANLPATTVLMDSLKAAGLSVEDGE